MVEKIRLRNDVARLASIEQSVVMSKNGYRGPGKIDRLELFRGTYERMITLHWVDQMGFACWIG